MLVLSIVIPILNEEANLGPLLDRLSAALTPLSIDYEIIFVDCNSVDGSMRFIADRHQKDPRVKAISLSRRFGHQVALTAGLDHARGSAVLCMDGDLQHPPEVIPRMLEQWRKGFEIVYAQRDSSTRSSVFKRVPSALFYWFFRKITGVALPPSAADFRLFDRKVVDAFYEIRERNRFLRGLAAWVGFQSTVITYTEGERTVGRSKYGPRRMLMLALDGLVSFSSAPLYAGILVGCLLGVLTFLYVLFALYAKFVIGQILPGWTSIAVLIGSIGSLQLLGTGLLGLYIGKIYEEVKHRPLYLMRQQVGIEPVAVPPR